MIAKLFGCGLILAAAFAASLQKIKKEKRRLAIYDLWISFLSMAKSEIGYNLTPAAGLAKKIDPAFSELLFPCDGSPEGYLAASEKELDRDSFDALSAFLVALGSSYREDLLCACDRALAALEKKRQKLSLDLPQKTRALLSLSFLAAGLAILLLW